jgi:DNA polymerase III epsilon subunit-like protein
MKLLVFDTETTGLPKFKNSSIYKPEEWPYIIQLSYIIYDMEKNKIEIVDDYINIPDNIEISEDSTKIHGIDREKCKKGISIQEALAKFINYINFCDIIVGHNISFDKRMIIVEGIRNKQHIFLKDKHFYCTMKESADICKIEKINNEGEKYFKYPTLSELHKFYFKKEPKNTHNAIVDVLICFKCYMKMRYDLEITNINRDIRHVLRGYC